VTNPAPAIVKLKPSVNRILAALFYVMSEAKKRPKAVSQYDLVKTLFLADRAHLNEWGRPITYDNYTAMLHGPVPSLAYNLLKSDTKAMRDVKLSSLPWTSVATSKTVRHFFPLDDALDVKQHLSRSDMDALTDALGTVLRLGFGQIRRLTHEDPAYVDAWRDENEKGAYAMKLGLLFDEPNFEQAASLEEVSQYV
jgi:uncharacterized phage-associated protein